MWWIVIAGGIGVATMAATGIAGLARQLPGCNEDFDVFGLPFCTKHDRPAATRRQSWRCADIFALSAVQFTQRKLPNQENEHA